MSVQFFQLYSLNAQNNDNTSFIKVGVCFRTL